MGMHKSCMAIHLSTKHLACIETHVKKELVVNKL